MSAAVVRPSRYRTPRRRLGDSKAFRDLIDRKLREGFRQKAWDEYGIPFWLTDSSMGWDPD